MGKAAPITILRPATEGDVPALVTLNAAVVEVTSPMDAARCRALMALAAWCVVAETEGRVTAFVLAMREGAPYANGNFAWFADRLRRFAYIDRVVVGDGGRGQGLGGRLYDWVEEAAREAGCLTLAAEMNVEPPNEGSLGFHRARGFVAIGQRRLDKGVTVSMQVCAI